MLKHPEFDLWQVNSVDGVSLILLWSIGHCPALLLTKRSRIKRQDKITAYKQFRYNFAKKNKARQQVQVLWWNGICILEQKIIQKRKKNECFLRIICFLVLMYSHINDFAQRPHLNSSCSCEQQCYYCEHFFRFLQGASQVTTPQLIIRNLIMSKET